MLNMVAARSRTRSGARRRQPYEQEAPFVVFSVSSLTFVQQSSRPFEFHSSDRQHAHADGSN